MCYMPRPSIMQTANNTGDITHNLVQVLVNGQASKALVDTSNTQTLALESLVPEDELFNQARVKVCCVYGDIREYPPLRFTS